MARSVGAFWKTTFDKSFAFAMLQFRNDAVGASHRAREVVAYQRYRSRYLGKLVRAPLSDVIENLDTFARLSMGGWIEISRTVSTVEGLASFVYTLEFSETFLWGSRNRHLKPRTITSSIHRNLLRNNNQNESVAVDYRFIFRVSLTSNRHGVVVDSELVEHIDPQNACPQLCSGAYEVPSLLPVRSIGVSPEGLLKYLHSSCDEERPDYRQWLESECKRIAPVTALKQESPAG